MKNWTMDLLKYRPFPELAAALRQRKAMVIERWLETVRGTLPAAHELTLIQVRNELPQTLDLMADALEADEPKATKDLMDQAVTHGESRFDQNFALNEVMIEYGLLRPILTEEMAEHLNRVVTVEEIQALNLAVDIAERRGVVAYVTQQKAELQALVEAQTKYLSFLSHDLRGGLNGVLLMIEVLRRDLETEPKFGESLNDLEVMKRSILETVSTMDRFLHAERFRKGKVQIKPAEMDLCALAREMVGQFGYQAKDKGLELAIVTPADGARVVSDRELLTMILQNLVGNAIKYSRRGTVRVIVERDGGPEHPWRLAVSDQGPGLDPAKAADLFKPFSRGETFGQAGTGLGLSIARQAADLLGATLWAESKQGEGSKFCLDLPPEPPTRAA